MNTTTFSKKDLASVLASLAVLGALTAALVSGTPPALHAQSELYEQCDEVLDPNDPLDCMFSITPAIVGGEDEFTMDWSCPDGYTADIQSNLYYMEAYLGADPAQSGSANIPAGFSDTFQLFCRPGPGIAGTDIPGVVGAYAYGNTSLDDFELAVEGAHVFVKHGLYNQASDTYDVSVDIFDVSDPAHMQLLGTYEAQGTYAYYMRVSQGYLYLLTGEGVEIANVASPSAPAYVTTYASAAVGQIYTYDVSGNYLYVKGGDASPTPNRVGVVDVSNPGSLTDIGTYDGELSYYSDVLRAKGSSLFLNGIGYVEGSGYGYTSLLQTIAASPGPALAGQLQEGINFYLDALTSYPMVSGDYLFANAFMDEQNDDYNQVLMVLDTTTPSSLQIVFDGRLNPLTGGLAHLLKAYAPYLITDNGEDPTKLNVYNISDPANPSFEKSIFSLGASPVDGSDQGAWIRDVVGRGEYLFAVSFDSDPAIAQGNETPTLYAVHVPSYSGGAPGLGYNEYTLELPEGIGELEAFNQGAVYTASGNRDSIVSINVSSPTNPAKGSRYPSGGGHESWDSWSGVSNNVLYTNVGTDGVLALDISDPHNPIELSETSTGPIEDGTIAGDRMYLASPYYEGGDVSIYDIANPSNPTLLSTYESPTGYLYGLVASGQYLYGINDNNRPEIISVSNPASPVLVSEVDLGAYASAKELMVLNGYLYVFDWDSVLRVFDISDPASPVQVSSYYASDTGSGYISGSLLYYVDNSGVTILDISDPAGNSVDGQLPVVGSYVDASGVGYAGHSGTYVFLRNNEGSVGSVITIVDVSNPANPVGAYEYSPSGYMDGPIFGTNQYLFALDEDAGAGGVFHAVEINSLPVPASSLALRGIEVLTVGSIDYTLYVNDEQLYESAASQVYWQFGSSVTSCTITGPNVSTSTTVGEGSASTGQLYLSHATEGLVTYTMQCAAGQTQLSPIYATIHIVPGCYSTSQTCLFKAEPQTVLSGETSTLTWSCPAGDTSSTGYNFSTGGLREGTQGVTPVETSVYTLECAPSGAQGQVTVTVPADYIVLSSATKTVRSGTPTTLSWNAHNVIPGSCTLSGNGTSLNDSANSGNPAQGYVWSGSTATADITHATEYRLTCQTATGPVTKLYTIGIVPTYQER